MVVFADVEPLIDEGAPAWSAAGDTLRAIAAKGLPLVFCSSRTRAEIEYVQAVLGAWQPFVCENGAAVVVPRGVFAAAVPGARRVDGCEVVSFGPPYGEVVTALTAAAGALGIGLRAFHQMSVAEIAQATGLSAAAAARARRRAHAEPFRFESDDPRDRERLADALEARGLRLASGARFDCAGPAVDEGRGIALVRELFERELGRVLTVGIGDPLRDEALLDQVDVPITALGSCAVGLASRIAKTTPVSTDERRVRRCAREQRDAWHPLPHATM